MGGEFHGEIANGNEEEFYGDEEETDIENELLGYVVEGADGDTHSLVSDLTSINTVVNVKVKAEEESVITEQPVNETSNETELNNSEDYRRESMISVNSAQFEYEDPPISNSLENSTESTGSTPSSIVRVSASEERSLLDRLTKLGFGDREKNRLLLMKHEYNLQSVVKELINSFEPLR